MGPLEMGEWVLSHKFKLPLAVWREFGLRFKGLISAAWLMLLR
ncbi:MAG: hypothetical protein AB8E87_07970 [Prochlorococcus sp.]